jgi:SAM-dependent methyltransferase
MRMDRLTDGIEHLDGPLDDPAALEANLRDLRWFNRHLGGIDLSDRAIERLAAGRTAVTLLDVGTGAADIPLALLDRAAFRPQQLQVVAVDSRPEIRAAALRVEPRLARDRGLTYEVHDGRSLPYPDGSFDVAHVSMVVHHFEPRDAVALLRELGRVARLGVVVNELDRTRHGLLGARLLTRTITRGTYTRDDGPLSVRRSYRPTEMEALLIAAGHRPTVRIRNRLLSRYAIVAVPSKRVAPAAAHPS